MNVAVISITRHGIATAGRVVAALPGAQLFAGQCFHGRGVPHHHQPVAHIRNDREIVTDDDKGQVQFPLQGRVANFSS